MKKPMARRIGRILRMQSAERNCANIFCFNGNLKITDIIAKK